MSNIAIKAENISKAYQLGEFSTGTISQDFERAWARLRGKEDPFLKIGEKNDRAIKGSSNIVWSLKDINFEIEKGDAVGIIGRNGAGKSTLLKVLSRVTSPTTGQISGIGRIASLLEVGTGFHPELTGRENIFLNGAILGMRKMEIARKFDEIVHFSGVERYIDTPVKRYSSGMYVRLAFAVAAHLESEILIVDEVLAVGDAEFQKQCLGKMNDISKGEGRTVLFVSHNMGSINQLCNNAILLNTGSVEIAGPVNLVIDQYVNSNSKIGIYTAEHSKQVSITKAFTSNGITVADQFGLDNDIVVIIEGNSMITTSLKVGIALLDKNKSKVFTSHYDLKIKSNEIIKVSSTIPKEIICPGTYSFDIALFLPNGELFDYVSDICPITIIETGSLMYYDQNYGSVFVNCIWNEYHMD
jgi:lipopolysaccharide transport system ATP-binding protein